MTTCCYEGCSAEWDEYVVFTPVNTELGYCSRHAETVRSYFEQEHDEGDMWTPPREISLNETEAEVADV